MAIAVTVAVAGPGVADFDLLRALGVDRVSQNTFLDMRAITSGWECHRQGIDVLAHNPCDPFGRPLNYPRVWTWPAGLGLEQDSAEVLGPVVGLAFLGAVLLVVGPISLAHAAVYAAVLASSAVVLGLERGNIDLLMFTLVVLALLAFRARSRRGIAGAGALIALAGVLKIFPFFAGLFLLRQSRRAAVATGAVLATLAGAYALLTRDDLRLIGRGTPFNVDLSFGAQVLWDGLRQGRGLADPGGWPHPTDHQLVALVTAFVVVVAAIALAAWVQAGAEPPGGEDDRRRDALWAGAGVYVGTFALGHNIDYRLMFLILLLPQSLEWAGRPGRMRPVAVGGLVAIFGALWLGGRLVDAFPFDEIANWLVVLYALTALAVTPPDWLAGGRHRRPTHQATMASRTASRTTMARSSTSSWNHSLVRGSVDR